MDSEKHTLRSGPLRPGRPRFKQRHYLWSIMPRLPERTSAIPDGVNRQLELLFARYTDSLSVDRGLNAIMVFRLVGDSYSSSSSGGALVSNFRQRSSGT